MNTPTKILITGGSGFIGTNIVQYYLDKDFSVLNVDNQEPKNPDHIHVWCKISLCDKDELIKAVVTFNPDYIIHLGARTDLQGKSLEDYKANTIGVYNILEAAKKLKNLKKIIVTSSMLVCKSGYIPKNQEDYNPSTIYGQSKIETEKLTWQANLSMDWAIIRPSSIWGEFFGIPYRNFFDMILRKRYFHIGHRSATKTYGYIGNAVYQINQLLYANTNDKSNKIFYIGDYTPTNIKQWGTEIAVELYYSIKTIPYPIIYCVATFGSALNFIGIKFPMTLFRLRNMTTNNIVPTSNTQTLAPELPYTRQEGIKRTLKWIRNNE